jgi:hypothetical protein
MHISVVTFIFSVVVAAGVVRGQDAGTVVDLGYARYQGVYNDTFDTITWRGQVNTVHAHKASQILTEMTFQNTICSTTQAMAASRNTGDKQNRH